MTGEIMVEEKKMPEEESEYQEAEKKESVDETQLDQQNVDSRIVNQSEQSKQSHQGKQELMQEVLVADSNVANLEQKVEAILFMAGKSVSITDIQKITGADLISLKQAISNLQHWYSSRKSWLEIIKVDKSYLMRLKPEYTDIVTPIVQETELSKRSLRVLAVIAKNNGVLQSKVVKMLGPSVYDAVKELKQKGYITTEVKGHSKILKLTKKFTTYFGEIPV
jgi:segregation and condensation protein B